MLRKAVENEDNFNSDESLNEIELSENEEEEFRFDWIRLAKMRSNSRIISLLDLDSRDTDQNHDWVDYTKQFYFSNDITRVSDFVHEASSTSQNAAKGNDNINYKTLNENQKNHKASRI